MAIFHVGLSGEQEVDPVTGEPGAGDPDGSGTAKVTVDVPDRAVCSDIAVSDIALPATGAHIHEAPVGVNGPIVVPLAAPEADGTASGCVEDVDAGLLRDIRDHPENYYVNVHNEEYPAGAVSAASSSSSRLPIAG